MESVGVRELKEHMAQYLHTVQQGQSVLVTEQGKPIARLSPVSPQEQELAEQMEQLAAEGFLAWNGGAFQVPEPVAVNRGAELVSDLVVADRR